MNGNILRYNRLANSEDSFILSFTVSAFLHLSTFLLFFISSFLFRDREILLNTLPDTLTVEVVSEQIQTRLLKPITERKSESPPLPPQLKQKSEEKQSLLPNKPVPKLLNSVKHKTTAQTTPLTKKNARPLLKGQDNFKVPPTRYGALLASHLQEHAPDIPDDLTFSGRIDLWITIDRNGYLKEHGILNIRNKTLSHFIVHALKLASPFPKPPAEHLSSQDITYKFSIFLD